VNLYKKENLMVKETENNRIQNLGNHGVSGGPGRPRGSVSALTKVKRMVAEDGRGEQALAILDEMLSHKNMRYRIEAVKLIASLMPREDKVEGQLTSLVIEYASAGKCEKCGEPVRSGNADGTRDA